MIDLTMSI